MQVTDVGEKKVAIAMGQAAKPKPVRMLSRGSLPLPNRHSPRHHEAHHGVAETV